MSLTADIEQRLAALAPRSIELTDDSAQHAGHGATGAHFTLTIVSEHFAGQTKLQRHRAVYAALGPLMHREIHALAIRAFTPDEL